MSRGGNLAPGGSAGPCAALLLTVAVAACSRSISSAAVPTQTAAYSETPLAGTPTSAPISVTEPPTPAACHNSARFLDDLTVPDGTRVAAGQSLDKRWSVENDGTCDWGPDYRLVHVAGEGLTGPDEVALFPARAGSTAVWQVQLQAPQEPGEYMSQWQARAPDGSLFGDVVFVIVVVAPIAPTP